MQSWINGAMPIKEMSASDNHRKEWTIAGLPIVKNPYMKRGSIALMANGLVVEYGEGFGIQ